MCTKSYKEKDRYLYTERHLRDHMYKILQRKRQIFVYRKTLTFVVDTMIWR